MPKFFFKYSNILIFLLLRLVTLPPHRRDITFPINLNITTMEKNLFELLASAYEEPLPYQLQRQLLELMQEDTFRKNEIVLQKGKINDRLYFIQRGLLRAYSVEDGVEETTWLRGEGEFVVAIPSFYDQSPSDQSIHALERTDVFSLTYSQFYSTLKKHLEFAYIGFKLQTAVLLEWNERGLKLKKLDMLRRLEWLYDHHPNLFHRTPGIPDKYLASYLGMTPEHFSKIKANFFRLSGNSAPVNGKAS